MPSPLTQAGAISDPSRYAPLYVNQMFTGLVTRRSPLREGAVPFLYQKFYGGSRFDSLLDGLNREISPDMTLIRRPGHSVYNSATFPAINRFYEFRTTATNGSERIYAIADTGLASGKVYDATGPSTQSVILNKSADAGSCYFCGVGNTLYMGDGAEQKKWTPGGSASDWGSDGPTDAPTDTPLMYAGAPCRYWAPNSQVQPGYAILDGNLNVQLMTGNTATAESFTTRFAPTVLDNSGAVPATLPVSVGGSSPAHAGFNNAALAVDGAATTAAQQSFQHTNKIGCCVWGFAAWSGASPTSITLNVLSASAATIMSGTPMNMGVWYTLDGGTTWTAVWSQSNPLARANQWNAIVVPAGQNMSLVQVCAYFEAHDDAGMTVAEISASIGTSTVPTAVAGDKTTGATTPKWQSELYALTLDNTAVWQNMGAPGQWQAKTPLALDGPMAAIIDGNGNLQVVQQTGVTGDTEPTWKTGASETTTDGTVVWLNCGAGATVATSGHVWSYAFHMTDGQVTNAAPISLPSGPIMGKMAVPLSGLGSANADCDKVWLFRNGDGGSEALLLKLDEVSNPAPGARWTFTDTHPDADLNELIQAAVQGENTPPPDGSIALEYHMGRIWMIVGNMVYYTRATSAIGGDPLSCVPPGNYFGPFPSKPVRLFSCSIGLLVFTRSQPYIILGRGTDNDPFWTPGSYAPGKGCGLLHYDAFCVHGATPYYMTSARKVIAFDPGAGVIEPGAPIGDQFKKVTTGGYSAALYDPATAFLTWHEGDSGDTGLFVSDGATGWFRMAPTPAPETGMAWSPFAALAVGCSAVQSFETSPGVHDLLVGPKTSGPILRRDTSVNTDNGTTFAGFEVIGSIVMAQPGQIAELEFITLDSVRVGTRPTLSVLLGELSGRFEALRRTRQDPPLLPPSKTIWNDRYSMSQNQQATLCRHFQLRLDWKAEDARNELLAYAVFGAVHTERRAQ